MKYKLTLTRFDGNTPPNIPILLREQGLLGLWTIAAKPGEGMSEDDFDICNTADALAILKKILILIHPEAELPNA